MVWTSDVPGDEEHPGVTIAASLVILVLGLLALWGAWKMGVFAWAVVDAHAGRSYGRMRGDSTFIWWAIVAGLGMVGGVFVLGGFVWLCKGVSAAVKGESVK